MFRRPEISFSQGARWKALISKYIGTIPPSGDAPAIDDRVGMTDVHDLMVRLAGIGDAAVARGRR